MNLESIIVIVILVILLIPAILNSIKHMKGEGDCCGGPKEKRVKKKIHGKKLAELVIKIDGMHCENCRNRIEKHLDELDGVIAKVNLEKKQAVVSLYQEVDMEKLKAIIEKLDFTVLDMKKIEKTVDKTVRMD